MTTPILVGMSELSLKIAIPIYSIKISPAEMEQSKKVRALLKDVVLKLDQLTDSLKIFSSIISELRDVSDINQVRRELVSYKHKIQGDTNDLLTLVEGSLTEWNKMISDSNFDSIKRAYIEEIRKLREDIGKLLERLRRPTEPSFLQDTPQDVNNIIAARLAINEIISAQLFQKIDRDILGRIKIGTKIVNL
jgi:glutaredoxin 2